MRILQLLRAVFEGHVKAGDIDRPTARIFANYLQRGVLKGYGKNFTKLTFGTAEHELLAQLHYNTAVFSAFKNHKQVTDIVAALTDERGRLRSWAKFRDAAKKVSKVYNTNWLQAEYTTAILQAESANKWLSFRQAAKDFPNLRYSAVQDSRTRPQHRTWHGILRPISDPFWDTHYPPNGWRCRCTAYQTDSRARKLPKQLPRPEKGFRNNAGKTGMLWSTAHPYYKGASKALAKEAKRFATSTLREQVKTWAFKNLAGKVFKKEGLQATFTHKSIKKTLNQPHSQKYFQMLTLLDFERLLKEAKPYKPNTLDDKGNSFVKAWHYFEIDIYGTPSLINIREEVNGATTIYSISEKGE